MTDYDLEATYEAMALQIDRLGPGQTELYLAKLALLLANRLADTSAILECVEQAADSLEVET